jgi:predicted metal-dependent HD superfamily phosphohydrolase
MNYHALLIKVQEHVNLFYLQHPDTHYFYHNRMHTKEVLEAAQKIGSHYQLDDRSFFIVCAAASFHDIGFIISKGELHEEKGAALADTFLRGIEVNENDIGAIKNCILATKMPQTPVTPEEKIVCDADLFNLGTLQFKEKNKLLKKEREALGNIRIDGITWRATSISLLQDHHYHTDYCKSLLDKTKAENLAGLQIKQTEKLNAAELNAAAVNNIADNPLLINDKNDPVKPLKIKKKDRPVKGIETMFRISASNNVRISVMADNKAHIMISVNSIIISVVLALLLKNINENRHLLIPSVILLVVNVATIIYAVSATRPKIPGGTFTQAQVDNKSVNLLYFGSFYNMDFKEYNAGIKAMMADSEFLYGSLTKDIFWQGKVLGRKYRLLRISYTIFMYGLVTAVVAFGAAIIFF